MQSMRQLAQEDWRGELGLLCGALASSPVMAALLRSLLRERLSLDTESRIAETQPA
jgi:hypothetical protein